MFNHNEWRKERRKKRWWWLGVYKLSHGCQKCGGEFEACELDLHHVDPSTKEIKPSDMAVQNWSISRMLTEVKKCKVLCKKCHREEHRRPMFGDSKIEF